MNRSALRDLVIDVLRKTPQTHFRAVENEVRRLSEEYEKRDVLLLNEILWELLLQGILAPGKNSLNPDLPFVHVTEYGARSFDGGALVAHDPDRYIERLIAATQEGAPSLLIESARVALESFLDGRHASALVLLSHAAEHVLHDLATALIRRGREADHGTKRLEAALSEPRKLGASVRRSLSGYRLPEPLARDIDSQIGGLATLVDAARSKRGLPRIPSADRDTSRARFLLFLDQCRFAYDAMRWLEGSP